MEIEDIRIGSLLSIGGNIIEVGKISDNSISWRFKKVFGIRLYQLVIKELNQSY